MLIILVLYQINTIITVCVAGPNLSWVWAANACNKSLITSSIHKICRNQEYVHLCRILYACVFTWLCWVRGMVVVVMCVCVVAFGVWWWCLVCACVVASGCGEALHYIQHCLAYQPTYSTSIAIHVVFCSSLHLLPTSLGLHIEGMNKVSQSRQTRLQCIPSLIVRQWLELVNSRQNVC